MSPLKSSKTELWSTVEPEPVGHLVDHRSRPRDRKFATLRVLRKASKPDHHRHSLHGQFKNYTGPIFQGVIGVLRESVCDFKVDLVANHKPRHN